MGAGCLFFDSMGKLLILKPTYRNHWLLPGGVIEADESPRQACIREVKEETGIDCQPNRLLCVDYVNNRQKKLESVQFVFLGGVLPAEIEISLPKKEIVAYQFLEPTAAISLLGSLSRSRYENCLLSLKHQETMYLENGRQVTPTHS